MNEADRQYIKRKTQKDWEYDEPEPSDYAMFVKQVKGLIVWFLFGVGIGLLILAVLK